VSVFPIIDFDLLCTTEETAVLIAATMADLDDFFAKKDKKKKKSGFSKANTDIISKNLEESERKSEQKAIDDSKAAQLATSEAARASMAAEDAKNAASNAKDGAPEAPKAVSGSGGGYHGTAMDVTLATTDAARRANLMMGLGDDGTNDDDWVSVEEEKKDYSGLKIGTLKIEDKDAEPEEEHEINEEGERVPVKRNTGDVWAQRRNDQNASPDTTRDASPNPDSEKSSDPSPPAPSAGGPASAAGEPSKPSSSGGGSSYVPPHMRGGPPRPCDGPALPSQTPTNAALAGRRQRGPRAAPDMNSEVLFPSLGGGGPPGKSDFKRSDFEEVRRGQQHHGGGRAADGPSLALDNKFAALRD